MEGYGNENPGAFQPTRPLRGATNATRDIIDANNQNSRAILDFLTQSKLSDLQTENQNLKLAASQAAQNSYLVSQLRPSPIPAYTVQNPYCCNQFACCGC